MFFAILKLIRIQNLLLIAFAQWAFHFFIIKPPFYNNFFPMSLTEWQFGLLLLATALIGAAGNIINDFFDMEMDEINKPEKLIVGKIISEETAQNLFYILNGIALIIAFYLSYEIGQKQYISLFILCIVLLWAYSSELKKKPLIGNLIIAFLCAFSIIIIWIFERGLFDLVAYVEMRHITKVVYYSMIFYAGFAFITSLIREIVKDFQDEEGDYKFGSNSLPIWIGHKWSKLFLGILNLCFFVGIFYVVQFFSWEKHRIHILYLLIALCIPMLFNIFFSMFTNNYSKASLSIKVCIFMGILSIPVFYYLNNPA